jgi:ABC-2 type transport system ATP-binding protein
LRDDAALPVNAVEAKGLDKTYRASGKTGAKHALKAIDLAIPRGGIFGLLGPNGAGKSTFINILAGLVNKSGGSAAIWGYDIDKQTRQARASIGVVPQELNIDPFFTPYELLELQAGLYGVPPKERQTMDILQRLGLADKSDAYARTLSGGMRRRLMVAKAMVHNPPVLVLDEPTAGVDIELRQQLWSQVRELNENGVTIVLTTHYLEEAEELCDEIAIIHHGEVIACDSTQALLRRLDNKTLTITFAEAFERIPADFTAFQPEKVGERSLRFQYRTSDSPLPKILAAAAEARLTPVDVSTLETDLEDIFLQLTRGAHEREAS